MTTTYDKLYEQNHKITELSNVLQHLFKDRSMCDNDTCCGLFSNYMKLVREHIDTVDKFMVTELLNSPDDHTNNVVKNFMSGSIEVKRILNKFNKHWCPKKHNHELLIKNHGHFLDDVDELFDIVLKRILDETEHLYPLSRSVRHAA